MSMTKVIDKISIVGEKILAKNYLEYAYVIYLVTHPMYLVTYRWEN